MCLITEITLCLRHSRTVISPKILTILLLFEKLLEPIILLVFFLNTSNTGIVLILKPIFFRISHKDFM